MASVNTKRRCKTVKTAGGAQTFKVSEFESLQRSVLGCMLWENSATEDGVAVANRIRDLIAKCDPAAVGRLIVKARTEYGLRHVPLYMMVCMATNRTLTSDVVANTITRPDDMCEFLALYWATNGLNAPLASAIKRGLAKAFAKFDKYQLAKWAGGSKNVSLRDVMRLVHPTPPRGFKETYKELAAGTLSAPPTWETRLSAGESKNIVFTSLLQENKLGATALLYNLRNMIDAGVNRDLIAVALGKMNPERVFPYQFIKAVKHAPSLQTALNIGMINCLRQYEKIKGKTVVILDVSGSMNNTLTKGETTRLDAAAAIVAMLSGVCEDFRFYFTAGSDLACRHATVKAAIEPGLGVAAQCTQAMYNMGGGGIFLAQALDYVKAQEGYADRVVVITDEVDTDSKLTPDKAPAFGKSNYIINIATDANGIAYNKFTHINGFSTGVIDFLIEMEKR